METNWVEQDSSFVGFTPERVNAILEKNPAASVACAGCWRERLFSILETFRKGDLTSWIPL
jgi:hypothetical protein